MTGYPDRGRRAHAVEQPRCRARLEHGCVVDAIAAGQRCADHRGRLRAAVRAALPRDGDVVVDQAADIEFLRQQHRDRQPAVGQQRVIVEGHRDALELCEACT